VVLSATVNFSIVFAVVLVFLAVLDRFPGWAILGFLPLLVMQQALAVGLGVTVGTLNVFVRDVAHAVGVVLQFWFWCTPIVYPVQILGETTRALLSWNPMFGIITAYQGILLHDRWPAWTQFSPQAVVTVVALGLALLTFRRLSGAMADYL
jgi:lipopolysaccharide transport system permease protein